MNGNSANKIRCIIENNDKLQELNKMPVTNPNSHVGNNNSANKNCVHIALV